MARKKLSDKEKRFAEEYLISLSAEKAALAAGYSTSTARKLAPLWIGGDRQNKKYKPDLVTYIEKLKGERSERTGITADYVLDELRQIYEADISEILNDEGTLRNISEWPPVWRRICSGIDIKELFQKNGKQLEKVGEVLKVKFADKLRTLELVGKHIGVNAFQENVNHKGNLQNLLPPGFKIEVVSNDRGGD